jgi:hypothetical protein
MVVVDNGEGATPLVRRGTVIPGQRALPMRMLTVNSVNIAMSLPLMLVLIYYSNHWN